MGDTIQHLTPEDILRIHEDLLHVAPNGLKGMLRPGVEEAISHGAYYLEPQDIGSLAAFYLSRIAKSHIFADLNKRVAYFGSRFFLMKNGADFNGQDPNEATQEMIAIASAPNMDAAYALSQELAQKHLITTGIQLDYRAFRRLVIKSIGVATQLSQE